MYKDKLYNRGYIFSNVPCKTPDYYAKVQFKGYTFAYDPRSTTLILNKNANWVFVSGTVIDLLAKTDSIEYVSSMILKKREESETAFLDYLDTLSGRHVVILCFGSSIKIYNDACGIKMVFYSFTEKRFFCASHLNLIALNQAPKLSLQKEISRKHGIHFRAGYPGNTTPHDNVYIMTPNTCLDVTNYKIERYFPREDLEQSSDLETIVNKVEEYFKTQIEIVQRTKIPAISLTAGYDSRFTLAVLHEYLERGSVFFTYRSFDKHDVDVYVSKVLAGLLNLNHRVIDVTGDPPAAFIEFNQVLNKNTYYNHGRKIAYGYTEYFDDNYVHIRSNVSEIGRLFYGKRSTPRGDFGPLNMKSLYMPKLSGDEGIVKDSFNTFHDLVAFDRIFNYDPYDMFYWEHRMGVWMPLIVVESDMAFDTLIPFNCRLVLKLFLSLPENDRASDLIYKKIIEHKLPILQEVPINPSNWNANTSLEKFGIA